MPQPSTAPFSLEGLQRHGPILIANGQAYLREGQPPAWSPFTTLDSLEEFDLARMSGPPPRPTDAQTRLLSDAESEFTSLLPDAAKPYTNPILTFCIQAERHRLGRPTDPFVPRASRVAHGISGRLAGAIGSQVAVLFRGIILVPRTPVRNPGAFAGLPAQEEAFLRALVPGGAITLKQFRVRYEVALRARPISPNTCRPEIDDIVAATTAVKKTLASRSTHLGLQAIYMSEDTALSALMRASGQPVFTIESGPFAAEDADGSLYRFDGFNLEVHPAADLRSGLLAGTPVVMHPPAFKHWHPSQLHMCSYLPERPIANMLQMDNCVSLLLSGRHLLRGGLYGPPGSNPRLGSVFANRRISREQAEQLGLPIYPFLRGHA